MSNKMKAVSHLPLDDLSKEILSKKIIDGKAIADERNLMIGAFCEKLQEDYCITPTLAIVHIEGNFASGKYVSNKEKTGAKHGINVKTFSYDENVQKEELLQLVCDLNDNPDIHGIIVQRPLPKHIDENEITEAISALKDVDGFHPYNIGKLHLGSCSPGHVPCTAYGIIQLIKSTGRPLKGQTAVVIGRSDIVGRPVAALLEQENVTVSLCHSHTPRQELEMLTRSADIIVVAVGKPKFLSYKTIGVGKTIIDVGINRDENGKLCGDVDFDSASLYCDYITPVPGGVGPMTISVLMENTIRCALYQSDIDQDIFDEWFSRNLEMDNYDLV